MSTQTNTEAKYKAGDRVRVLVGNPPGHYRTPEYIQGKTGTVQRVFGAFRNPELLAQGKDGLPKKVLYSVGFPQREVWAEYDGSPADTLLLDIYEHWLEPA
ncbi:MAG: nitrile hydratase [Chloroflexi bacterium]|jgi:nitrile hydratase|nr:MAG: nitrile hydratase [Chloroflexota bacterium]